MKSNIATGTAPISFNPTAQKVAHGGRKGIRGKALVLNSEILLGIPSTAHILGEVYMEKDLCSRVIDKDNRIFYSRNLLGYNGSMISANLGVHPSLGIIAITERGMCKIPKKSSLQSLFRFSTS